MPRLQKRLQGHFSTHDKKCIGYVSVKTVICRAKMISDCQAQSLRIQYRQVLQTVPHPRGDDDC